MLYFVHTDNTISISYKEGLFLHINTVQLLNHPSLALTVAMPTSYQGGHFEGLLGNHDDDPSNDMQPSATGTPVMNVTSVDPSYVYHYANTCK